MGSYKLSADIIVFRNNLSQHLYVNYSVDLFLRETILFFRSNFIITAFFLNFFPYYWYLDLNCINFEIQRSILFCSI